MNLKNKNWGILLLLLAGYSTSNIYGQDIKWKIPPVYEEAHEFAWGYAVVGKKNAVDGSMRLGLIDTKGKVILPFVYTDIEYYPSQGAWVSDAAHFNRKYKLVNLENKVIIPFKYNVIEWLDSVHTIAHIKPALEQKILELTQEAKHPKPVKETPQYEDMREENKPYKKVDNYRVVLKQHGQEATAPFFENTAYTKISDSIFTFTYYKYSSVYKYEILNIHTNRIVYSQPNRIIPSEGGEFLVELDTGYNLINANGELQRYYPFEKMEGFKEGRAKIGATVYTPGDSRSASPRWGFADRSGKVRLEMNNDEVSNFSHGTAIISSPKEYTVVDTNFQVLYTTARSMVQGFGQLNDGSYYYSLPNKLTYLLDVNSKETQQISEEGYSVTYPLSWGDKMTAWEWATGKHGLVDIDRKVILPFVFDDLRINRLSGTMLLARYKGKWGYIDLKDY